MFSTLAIALMALLANPAPVALAQAIPPVAAPAPKGVRMISGTGWGQNIADADAAAEASLAAEEANLKANKFQGKITFGPVKKTRSIISTGWWPYYKSMNQTIMTRTWTHD